MAMSVNSTNNTQRPSYTPPPPPLSAPAQAKPQGPQGAQGPSNASQQGSPPNAVREAYQKDSYDTRPVGDKAKSSTDLQSLQTQPLSFLQQASNQPQDLGADSSSSTQAVQGTGSLSGSQGSAEQYLAKGPYSSDQVYPERNDVQGGLGQEKQQVWDAAKKAGATDAESAILTAQYMQEGSRDGTKDSQGDSANYGPFNLNGGMLKQFAGLSDDQLKQLNGGLSDPASLDKNVQAALSAMHTMGTEGYLNDVRGGQTGYEDPSKRISSDPGVRDNDTSIFGKNITNAALKVLADAQSGSGVGGNDNRYAGDVPHLS